MNMYMLSMFQSTVQWDLELTPVFDTVDEL